MKRAKEGRLHMRLDARLLKEIKEYADRRRMTVTALVEKHFADLLAEERRIVDAEQI